MAGQPEPPGKPADQPERQLTPEELELAARARAAAAAREALRRSEAREVSDFLSEILGPAPQPPPDEPPGPSLDLVLPTEPEPSRSGTPAAALAGAGENVEELAQFVSETPGEEALPSRRLTPSELADTHLRLQRLGLIASSERELEFEPESAAGVFERVTAELTAMLRRPAPALRFEPESAAGAAPLPQSAQKTGLVAPVLEAAPPAPPPQQMPPPPAPLPAYSLTDLPSAETPGPPVRDAAPDEGSGEGPPLQSQELPVADLLAPAAPPRPPAEPPRAEGPPPPAAPAYSVEDLPVPPPGAPPARPEAAEAPAAPEPALEEAPLDDAGLREALAAAGAVREHSLGGDPAAPEKPPPAPPRQYSLEDLPAAPRGPQPGTGSAPEEPAAPDDHLSEENLPELAPAPSAPGQAAGAELSGSLSTLERAVDRGVESSEAPPEPSPPPARAEIAADLSARQLADVERYLESQVDAGEGGDAARAARRAAGPVRAANLASRLREAAGRAARHAVKAADHRLEPWCLSCKRLLGLIGILILFAVAAYCYKVWILPWRPTPGE